MDTITMTIQDRNHYINRMADKFVEKVERIETLEAALRSCLRVLVECEAPCEEERKAVIDQAQDALVDMTKLGA